MVRRKCIHFRYDGEYAVNLCTFPRGVGSSPDLEPQCKGCENFRTETTGLEPCPFCGGTARLTKVSDFLGTFLVKCKKCHVSTETSDLKRAVDTWNTRLTNGKN